MKKRFAAVAIDSYNHIHIFLQPKLQNHKLAALFNQKRHIAPSNQAGSCYKIDAKHQ